MTRRATLERHFGHSTSDARRWLRPAAILIALPAWRHTGRSDRIILSLFKNGVVPDVMCWSVGAPAAVRAAVAGERLPCRRGRPARWAPLLLPKIRKIGVAASADRPHTAQKRSAKKAHNYLILNDYLTWY